MLNTVYTDKEKEQFSELINRLWELRADLIKRGFNPPWSATRGWEYSVVINATMPKEGDKVLDIGSMNSVVPFYLKQYGAKCYAVDVVMPNENDLAYYKECGIPYKEASIMELPFEDNFFDFITSVCVLEHISPWKNNDEIVSETVRGLIEAGRVLKSGGIMAHSCDFYHPELNTFRTYTKELLERIIYRLSRNGLTLEGGDADYRLLPSPAEYYLNNSCVYENEKDREEKHYRILREGGKPGNLFTCASLILRKE